MSDNDTAKFERWEQELDTALDKKNTVSYSKFKKYVPLFVSAVELTDDQRSTLSQEFIFAFDQYRPINVFDDSGKRLLIAFPAQRNRVRTINDVAAEQNDVEHKAIDMFCEVHSRGNVNVLSSAPEVTTNMFMKYIEHMDGVDDTDMETQFEQFKQTILNLAVLNDNHDTSEDDNTQASDHTAGTTSGYTFE